MVKLDNLYKIAEKHNIITRFLNLKDLGVLGLSIEKENTPPMIFLDNSIKKDKNKQIEVLSEELGHYFTSLGDSISNINTYKDKIEVNRCENKASKWATNFLITDEDIINLINDNIKDLYEMSEKLSVPHSVLLKKLKYLSITKQKLYLGNNKYLILTNYPNLMIYKEL